MRDSPVSESGSTSFQDFTTECTAEFTAEFTTPIKERSEAFPLYQRNWGKLSQKTEDYHILIKRSHSTSSGSAQPTRQRDAALACISQAPLSSETFTPIKVKLVLPPSQYPTRADLTTIPMTEVEELLPGDNRRQSRREGDYLSFSYTHTKLRVRSRENY